MRRTMQAYTAATVGAFEAAESAALNAEDALTFTWPSWHPLYFNHGGLGGPTAAVLRLRRHAETIAERHPMAWHRDVAPVLVKRSRQAVCEFLGVESCNRLQLVPSVSTGLFAVMRAVSLKEGDVVVTTDVRYHSVEDTLVHLCACAGATLHTVRVPMPPASYGEVAEAWREGLVAAAGRGRVQLAVIDWVSSKPSMLFPVRDMVAACAEAGVPSLVDGAHVPGSVPEAEIALDELRCDFFCCTFSKWLWAPRSIAALYVREGSHLRWPHIDCSALDPAGVVTITFIKIGIRGFFLSFLRKFFTLHILRLSIMSSLLQSEPTTVVPQGATSTDETAYLVDNLTKGIYDESTRSHSECLGQPL